MLSEDEQLSSLIGGIYDAALDPGLWPVVLEATAGFIRGPAAALVRQDAGDRKGSFYFSWGDDPHYTKLFFEKYIKIHPFLAQMTLVPVGIVFSVGDLIPLEEYHATRMGREWSGPQGYYDATSIIFERSGTAVAHLTVPRHVSAGPVDDQARRRMQLIGPHFQRAVAIGGVIKLQKVEADNMVETLDRLAAAIILVDGEQRIVFANAAAATTLSDGSVLRARRGRLSAADAQAGRRLREAVASAREGDAAIGVKGIDVHLAGPDGERWRADVLPLTSGARERSGTSHAATAAIFLRKADIDTPSSMQVMASLYRLTPAEIRVLHGIVAIGGVPAVANALGLSEATVKTHLQSLFDKTGSRRQAHLVKLLAAHASPFAN